MSKYIEVAFEPGDFVYVIQDGTITEMIVEYIYVAQRNRYYAKANHFGFNFREKEIGKEVFYSRQEAEAKLSKLDQHSTESV